MKAHALLDTVLDNQRLKNDAALSRFLDVNPPVLSKIRGGTLLVGPAMILKIHEKTDMPVRDIRFLLKQAPQEKLAA